MGKDSRECKMVSVRNSPAQAAPAEQKQHPCDYCKREARLPAPQSLRNEPPQARSVRAVYALGGGGQGMGQRAQTVKGAGAMD